MPDLDRKHCSVYLEIRLLNHHHCLPVFIFNHLPLLVLRPSCRCNWGIMIISGNVVKTTETRMSIMFICDDCLALLCKIISCVCLKEIFHKSEIKIAQASPVTNHLCLPGPSRIQLPIKWWSFDSSATFTPVSKSLVLRYNNTMIKSVPALTQCDLVPFRPTGQMKGILCVFCIFCIHTMFHSKFQFKVLTTVMIKH